MKRAETEDFCLLCREADPGVGQHRSWGPYCPDMFVQWWMWYEHATPTVANAAVACH